MNTNLKNKESNILIVDCERNGSINNCPLTDKQIRFLKEMLCDKDTYTYHMTVLRTFVRILGEKSNNHELYPLFKTLNGLLGALDDRDLRR